MDTLERLAKTLNFPVVALPDAADTVEAAVRFLVERLVEGGLLHRADADQAVTHVLKRERLGSTALGKRTAFPHSMASGVGHVVGVLARCSRPIPWEAPDGEPVRTICLVLGPGHCPPEYLRVLEQAGRAMSGGPG